MISYSVETFLRCERIEKVFVAVSEEFISRCEALFRDPRVKVIKGGETRGDTVAKLVKECEKCGAAYEDVLATHDAARPFVKLDAVENAIEAARVYGASGTALPATDTVLKCRNGFVTAAPSRSEMFLAQTPQCFKIGVFNEAWEKLSEEEKALSTDVCGMLCRAGVTVKIVEGSKECFKITFEEDMERAEEQLLKNK